jgi:hypothetical protein
METAKSTMMISWFLNAPHPRIETINPHRTFLHNAKVGEAPKPVLQPCSSRYGQLPYKLHKHIKPPSKRSSSQLPISFPSFYLRTRVSQMASKAEDHWSSEASPQCYIGGADIMLIRSKGISELSIFCAKIGDKSFRLVGCST